MCHDQGNIGITLNCIREIVIWRQCSKTRFSCYFLIKSCFISNYLVKSFAVSDCFLFPVFFFKCLCLYVIIIHMVFIYHSVLHFRCRDTTFFNCFFFLNNAHMLSYLSSSICLPFLRHSFLIKSCFITNECIIIFV